MTVDQLEKIFQIISTGSSSIKQLVLCDIADIHQINPETFAIGVNKLEFFDFATVEDNVFTEDQTKEMFKVMRQGTCFKMFGTTTNPMSLEWMDVNTFQGNTQPGRSKDGFGSNAFEFGYFQEI